MAEPVIRSIPSREKTLFLTFDDGPDPQFTPQVLDLLDKHGIYATFFVVSAKATHHKELVDRIIHSGHAIGNHSLDHTYSAFFSSRKRLANWIESSERTLVRLVGDRSVGFRPPAGVCTPPLRAVLKNMNLPLILWNTRFYDTVFRWTPKRARKSLNSAQPGDIILLHDSLRPKLREPFLNTLDFYLGAAKKSGFEFAPLTRENCSVTN